jgi:hypothetical protein
MVGSVKSVVREAATRDFWDRSETHWLGKRTAIGMFPMMR